MAKKKTKKTTYHQQRDQFFRDHPNAQLFIGLLIIAIAIWVGVAYRNLQARKAIIYTEYETTTGEDVLGIIDQAR